MSQPISPPAFDERWFSTALKSIGDAVIATDQSGRVLFMNPVAQALTGWADADARGRDITEVFPILNEVTRKPVEDPVAKVLASGAIVGLANHTVLIARGGREIPIDDSAAPITDEEGRVTGVVLVFRDITKKRRADEIRERLAAIIDSSDDAIMAKDLDGVITSWNKAAERMFGYTAEEAIGRHVSMLMPEGHVEDMAMILGKIRQGERVDHYETRRRRKDGQVIDVSLTVSPIRDAYGTIIGASKIARDVTEHLRLVKQLAENDRRKDEFLAMLAHELRNPLSAISNAAQVLKLTEEKEHREWSEGVILNQVSHLARMIDDLLDVSRITSDKLQLRQEPLDLVPIVNSAVESIRPLVEERKHRLAITLDSGPMRVKGDPTRLEQILVNLLSNAAKYTPPGGRIRLDAEAEGDQVVIKVKDNGIGMTEELLARAFDLFAQGDRSIARSEGGLGIGLTVVKRLVVMHGGTVTASSGGPGTGSEFRIRLPMLKPQDVETDPPTAPGAPERAKRTCRVLVVEDNPDTAEGLAKLLGLLGHAVEVAGDGPSALELARSYQPDAILLDLGLPGMDGYQVAQRLRDEGFSDTIIAVSGYGEEQAIARSRQTGFDHHLVKPVNFDDLTALIGRSVT